MLNLKVKSMNKSVKNLIEIANRYSYKKEVHRVGNKAFLSIYDNFLKSPYPRHITSVLRSYDYVKKMFDEN